MRRIPPSSVLLAALRVIPVCVCTGLGGCSYLETQQQRTAPADSRITLGWQDRVEVYPREIANYKCEDRYFLRCDRGGAITLSCTCSLH